MATRAKTARKATTTQSRIATKTTTTSKTATKSTKTKSRTQSQIKIQNKAIKLETDDDYEENADIKPLQISNIQQEAAIMSQLRHLHSLCLFLKAQTINPDYYYRKQSWNLMQTMHVYFFHTNEYMQSRNSSARKHRYMRQKSSYRIRQTQPTHADSPIRRRTTRKRYSFGAMDNININESVTNKELETLEIGPGFSHKISDSYSTNSNKIDSNRNSENVKHGMNNSDNYDDSDDDDDLDVNQITELIPNDYYAIQYQSTVSKVPLRVLEFGLPFAIKIDGAKYKNAKQEMLNNIYCKIEKKEWNELLKSCIAYSKKQNAKQIGLKLKHVVALKLYTDKYIIKCDFI